MTEKPYPYKAKRAVEEEPEVSYNSIVKLQSLLDAHVHYDGLVTGKHYEWMRAGSVVAVDAQDAPALLKKRIKAQSCCNSSDNAIFEIVD
jgi:hypothetical protein